MKNRLKNWLINKLSPYYRLINVGELSQSDQAILRDSSYSEFKRVLLKSMAQKSNENMHLLITGKYKSDEERGNLQGSIRTIADFIEMTSRLEKKTEEQSYEDIINWISKQDSV